MKLKKNVFIVCSICMLVLGIGYAGVKSYIDLKSEPFYYEITEQEREFLKKEKHYDKKCVERYETGMLYSHEVKQVEWVRKLQADLEERYPGYCFQITWRTHTGMFGPLGYYIYYIDEETTGRSFNAHVYYDDQRDYDYEEDNFYAYFVEKEYAEYIGGLLKEKGVDKAVATGGIMQAVMGNECDSTITVEDIVSGRIDIERLSPHVNIYLAAKGMTEEECKKSAEEVQGILEEIDLKGSYGIGFCDMTEEEIMSSEKEDWIYIYVHYCQSWNWGKEEE